MGKRHAVFIEIHGPRFSYHMAMRLFWHGCSILSTRLGIPLYHRLHCVVGQGMYTIQTAIEVEKRRDEEEQVIQKKKMWMEMSGKIQEHLFSSF